MDFATTSTNHLILTDDQILRDGSPVVTMRVFCQLLDCKTSVAYQSGQPEPPITRVLKSPFFGDGPVSVAVEQLKRNRGRNHGRLEQAGCARDWR